MNDELADLKVGESLLNSRVFPPEYISRIRKQAVRPKTVDALEWFEKSKKEKP